MSVNSNQIYIKVFYYLAQFSVVIKSNPVGVFRMHFNMMTKIFSLIS